MQPELPVHVMPASAPAATELLLVLVEVLLDPPALQLFAGRHANVFAPPAVTGQHCWVPVHITLPHCVGTPLPLLLLPEFEVYVVVLAPLPEGPPSP